MPKSSFCLNRISLLLFPIFWVGCASHAPRQNAPFASRAAEDLRPLKEEMERARTEQVDILAPVAFERALRLEKNAEAAVTQGLSEPELFHRVSEGRVQIKEASSQAQKVREEIRDVLEARSTALSAGAAETGGLYAQADRDFRELARAASQGDETKVAMQRNSVRLEFESVKSQAVRDSHLGAATEVLQQALKEGAKKYAPQTLTVAMRAFQAAGEALTREPYSSTTQSLCERAVFEANRLLSLTRESRSFAQSKSEDTALWVERNLTQVAGELSLADQRDKTFAAQWDQIGQRAEKLRTNSVPSSSLAQGTATDAVGTSSGSTPLDEGGSNFARVRAVFESETAEVRQEGEAVVIQFPTIEKSEGDEKTNRASSQWLSIDRAIRLFTQPEVVLAGKDQEAMVALKQFLLRRKTLTTDQIRIAQNSNQGDSLSPLSIRVIPATARR